MPLPGGHFFIRCAALNRGPCDSFDVGGQTARICLSLNAAGRVYHRGCAARSSSPCSSRPLRCRAMATASIARQRLATICTVQASANPRSSRRRQRSGSTEISTRRCAWHRAKRRWSLRSADNSSRATAVSISVGSNHGEDLIFVSLIPSRYRSSPRACLRSRRLSFPASDRYPSPCLSFSPTGVRACGRAYRVAPGPPLVDRVWRAADSGSRHHVVRALRWPTPPPACSDSHRVPARSL